jgi:hypothetical protein
LILLPRRRTHEYTIHTEDLEIQEKGTPETIKAINSYIQDRLHRFSTKEVVKRSQDNVFVTLDNSDLRDIQEIRGTSLDNKGGGSSDDRRDVPKDKSISRSEMEKELQKSIQNIFDTYKSYRKQGDLHKNESVLNLKYKDFVLVE